MQSKARLTFGVETVDFEKLRGYGIWEGVIMHHITYLDNQHENNLPRLDWRIHYHL